MYQQITFDQDQQSINNGHLKERQDQYADRYSKTITKNFLQKNIDQNNQEYQVQSPESSPNSSLQKRKDLIRQRRKNKTKNSFQPSSENKKIESSSQKQPTYLNIHQSSDLLDIEQQIQQIDISPKTKEREKVQDNIFLQNKSFNKPNGVNKKLKDMEFHLQNDDQQQKHVQKPIQKVIQKKQKKQQNDIKFLYEDELDQQQQIDQGNQSQVNIQRNNNILMFDQDNQSQGHPNIVVSSQNYFNVHNLVRFKEQLFGMIKSQHLLKMNLVRDNSGFNTFWPEFYLNMREDQRKIVSAKRTTARPISTFLISSDSKKFQQESNEYLGKMKSNAYGDIQYVFGPGYNPKNALQKGTQPRQMIGTIVYQSNFFNNGKPRQFTVFSLKTNVKYYQLKETKKYQDQIGLDQLFKIEQNKKYINVYKNKKPIWNEQLGGFMLNFRGRVSFPSIKNFILQDVYENQVMIFGRTSENNFVVQVNDKISTILAFAISLSTFDTKIICQ